MKTRSHKLETARAQPTAVVQIVLSQWGKPSRGGDAAIERNKMPEAVALPPMPVPVLEPSLLIHSISKMYDSIPAYSRTPSNELTVKSLSDVFECDCIKLSARNDVLHVDFQWNPSAGMPERYPKTDILVLQVGQWGQIRYNERHSPYHEVHCDFNTWWYEKWVFNIGLFTTVSPTLFIDQKPDQVYSQMEHLR